MHQSFKERLSENFVIIQTLNIFDNLGNTFEYFLEKGTIQSHITILGATSGDTGSAALHGLRGKKNVNCFIMYPKGKVTDIQERQMTSILDSNVHCISIDVSAFTSYPSFLQKKIRFIQDLRLCP